MRSIFWDWETGICCSFNICGLLCNCSSYSINDKNQNELEIIEEPCNGSSNLPILLCFLPLCICVYPHVIYNSTATYMKFSQTIYSNTDDINRRVDFLIKTNLPKNNWRETSFLN